MRTLRMEGSKTAKTLRYKTKAEFEAAVHKWSQTLSTRRERSSVQNLFNQPICGPCKDGSEDVNAIVFCQDCDQYMCAECKKADEKLYRGKNKHKIVPLPQGRYETEEFQIERSADKECHSKLPCVEQRQDQEKLLANPKFTDDCGYSNSEYEGTSDDESNANSFSINDMQLPEVDSIQIKDTRNSEYVSGVEENTQDEDDEETTDMLSSWLDFKDTDEADFTQSYTDGQRHNEDAAECSGDIVWESSHAGKLNAVDVHRGVENVDKKGATDKTMMAEDKTKTENSTESDETEFLSLRQEIDIRYHDLEDECDITDFTCLPNGDIVIADMKNKRLKVMTPQDNKRKLKLDSWPWNLAVSCLDDSGVYVTLPDAREIILINIGKHLVKKDTIKTTGDCWGIVCIKSGLTVSIWNENSNSGCIQILSFDGTVLETFQNTKYLNFLDCPSFLAVNKSETILYATDAGENSKNKVVHFIHMTDNSLEMKYSFQEKAFGGLCGITVDADESLYVTDLPNNCIHKLIKGVDGTYKNTVVASQRDRLVYPRCIYLNKFNKCLYIGGYTDIIKVYK